MQTMAIEKRKTTIDHSNNFIGIMVCPLSFKWFLSTVTHQTNGPCDINCTIQTQQTIHEQTLRQKQIQTQPINTRKNTFVYCLTFSLEMLPCRLESTSRKSTSSSLSVRQMISFPFLIMALFRLHGHAKCTRTCSFRMDFMISWTDNDTWQRR